MSNTSSYLSDFFYHRYNKLAILAASCTAVFASMSYGWKGFALVGVVALGAEIIAALGIPDLPAFRRSVDHKRHSRSREKRRIQLLSELKSQRDTASLECYEQMCARVNALFQTAGDRRTMLTQHDVDKLVDLTVDYLGLCVVNLSLKQRKDNANSDVPRRIASIEKELQNDSITEEEERQLRSALKEYTEILHRARRLAIRRNMLEATLLAIPDKMEEVYQLVMASPYSSEMGSKLEESLARLQVAEEVAAEFENTSSSYFDRTTTSSTASLNPAARQAARNLNNT